MPQKSPKLFSQNAQHSIEYVVLLTLIMAGIIIGGPYVIRSWNAQAKGWEDSVVDSMTDPLTEAPAGIVSIAGCDFVSWGPCGFADCCGLGYATIGCSDQQLLQRGVFDPPNCELSDPSMSVDLMARCVTSGTSWTDPAANHCCTPWILPSGCNIGDFNCPQDSDCGINATCIDGTSCPCPDGEYRRTRTCDTGYNVTECTPHTNCDFTCVAGAFVVPVTRATFCGDDTGLPGDRDYVIVTGCTPGTYCEYACNSPFVPRGSPPAPAPTFCDCPSGMTYGTPGALNRGPTCGPNECYRGPSCGPNECEICPGCNRTAIFRVATAPGSNGTNDQSAATSALLCAPIPITSISLNCPTGNPSGATMGSDCTTVLW